MCGIAGIYGRSDEKLVQDMTDIIAHRGPDGEGFFHEEGICTLGHRRLAIIDIEGSPQPMFSQDKNLVIVFNGEIYNFQEIRQELEEKGRIFQTTGDTEVILQSFEEWGEKCVEHFNGMWAFVIYDKKTQKLFCSRDRFGVKPFYYTFLKDGTFLFGSEIKSLLCEKNISKEVDPNEIDTFLSFRYSPSENTIFKNIKKLSPGSIAWVFDKQISIRKFWNFSFSPQEYKKESLEEFQKAFQKSVQYRMISDVSLGVFLSGGLDSSLIVSEMSDLSQKPVETFSVGFENKKYSELSHAKKISEVFKTHHHEFVTRADSFDLLKKMVWHLDEPLGDATIIPVFQISKYSRDYVTVVLSGEGADEFLGGYEKYSKIMLGEKLRPFFPVFLGKIFQKFFSQIKFQRLFAYFSAKKFEKAYLNLVSVFSEAEKEKLYSEDFKKRIDINESSEQVVAKYFQKEKGVLEKLQNLDIHTWLPNDLLLKGDKMTMAASIEQRVPFLDFEFAYFCKTLPKRWKIWRGQVKYILRKVLSFSVPSEIFKRKKQGFTVPLEMFREDFQKVLSKENIEKRGIFSYHYVQNLFRKDFANPFYRRQIFSLVMLELWFQEFVDSK